MPGRTSQHPSRSGVRPETLVGRSFRCGLHAVRSGDASNWSRAWQELAGTASPGAADQLLSSLAAFVTTVDNCALRTIEVLPVGCPGLCRDECLAVSIVAASQHGACPALRACAYALMECPHVDRPLAAASDFASQLREAGMTLPAHSVCNALAVLPVAVQAKN